MKQKIEKKDWTTYPEIFAIREDKDPFDEHYKIRIKIFRNKKTGELKFFGAQSVEIIGTQKIIEKLNK